MKAWLSSNFDKFATELRPLIDFRIEFLLCKFATELRPLIDVRIWFLLNILRTNKHIETKFCINMIIDKIYVGIVNLCFSQICNRVTALD